MAVTFPFNPLSSEKPGQSAHNFGAASAIWPALAIACVLCLQLHLVLTRSINWDEFHFLGQVHTFARGELTLPLQTLHVRFFEWLAALDMAGVDQIRIARLFMLLAQIVTCGAIIAIARRFVTLPVALLCALAYLSAGYVFQHGWSFRTDPMATALAMSALAILTKSRLNWQAIIAFALLMGAAFMVTIKIVLFAPAFAGIAWLRWSEANFSVKRAALICAGPIGAMAVAAALFAWHSAGLGPTRDVAAMVNHSGDTMFSLGGNPNLRFFKNALVYAAPFALTLGVLPFAMSKRTNMSFAEKVALLGLIAMILIPLFYRNTFPYFFALMFAPIAASLGIALEALSKRYGSAAVISVFIAWSAFWWFTDGTSQINKQRDIQIAANQMFDEPVNYMDFPGFLPRHRKVNTFLTGWGLRNYISGKRPKFTEFMAQKPVPLLATIDPQFNPSLYSAMTDAPRGFEFFPEDLEALKTTYRPVWGPLYVAGTTLNAGQSKHWRVWVPGPYKADAAITIEGVSYRTGDIITLDRGTVSLAARDDEPTGLLWGKNTRIPDTDAPERPYWTDF